MESLHDLGIFNSTRLKILVFIVPVNQGLCFRSTPILGVVRSISPCNAMEGI
jgi:hypothetical protein